MLQPPGLVHHQEGRLHHYLGQVLVDYHSGLWLHAGQVAVGHGGAGQVRPLDDGAQDEDFWKLLDEIACVNEK